MKSIVNYTPPSTEDLANLKDLLGYTGNQMAELSGLAGSNQWRKYTGGTSHPSLGMHYLFFIAAHLSLTDEEQERVLNKMQEIGARFDLIER